jgi:hypothetical protein
MHKKKNLLRIFFILHLIYYVSKLKRLKYLKKNIEAHKRTNKMNFKFSI